MKRLPTMLLAIVVTVMVTNSSDQLELRGQETNDPYILSPDTVAELKNTEISWRFKNDWGRGSGFPVIIGGTSSIVHQQGLRHLPAILKLLDHRDSFIAAHVLLTELWRIPEVQKPHEVKFIEWKNGYAGFTLNYNGLTVKEHWIATKTDFTRWIDISDEEAQRKSVRQFWLNRYRDHPDEFLTKTIVVE